MTTNFHFIKVIVLFNFLYPYFDAYEKLSDYKIFSGDPHYLVTNENFTHTN